MVACDVTIAIVMTYCVCQIEALKIFPHRLTAYLSARQTQERVDRFRIPHPKTHGSDRRDWDSNR